MLPETTTKIFLLPLLASIFPSINGWNGFGKYTVIQQYFEIYCKIIRLANLLVGNTG